jgi:cell division protein FtsB
LVTAAERAGLNLSCIVPATEAVRELVALTGESKGNTVLLASALPNATQLVLVDGAGTPLLFRSVAESWNRDAARVAMDIHRTLQFVQQQFDRTVSGVWLHGPDAGIAAESMSAQMPVPVEVLSTPEDDLFWADAAARISSNHPLNRVSRDQKQAPQRRVMVRFSMVLSLMVMLVALGVAAFVHRLQGLSLEMLSRLKKDEVTLKARYEALQAEYQKVARKESFLKAVGDNRQAPVHTWFLGYLSEALPMELLVTNVTARIQTNQWWFEIHGQAQPALVDRGERGFPAAFEKFTNALATGPIPIVFSTGRGSDPASGLAGQGIPSDWTTRLRATPGVTGRRPAHLNFSLEGVLQ